MPEKTQCYCLITLFEHQEKERCKINLPVQNIKFYVRFQATCTTKFQFCTLYDVKEKKIKCNNGLKYNEFYLFFYDELNLQNNFHNTFIYKSSNYKVNNNFFKNC